MLWECQLVTSLSNNNEKPLKMKLNMRSLPCSGANVVQHQLLLSSQTQAVTRNWQTKKKYTTVGQTRLWHVGVFEAGPWCNYNHIWPSQWAGDETNVSRKCEAWKLKDWYALGNTGLFSWCVCSGIFQMHSKDAWKWINQWGHLGRGSQDEKWSNADVHSTVASQT